MSIRVTPEVQAVNNGTDRAGGTTVRGSKKKKPADCSRGEGLLFMLMLDFVDTASFRLPLSPAAFSASFPTSLLPISSQLQPSRVLSCTICTTCNPTRQTGGACQVSLLPSVAIDVILWNALHVPPTLTAHLLPLVGARPSCSYRLALRLARLRQHRPDTLIMHCP